MLGEGCRRRCVLGLSAYATKIGRSLVPAISVLVISGTLTAFNQVLERPLFGRDVQMHGFSVPLPTPEQFRRRSAGRSSGDSLLQSLHDRENGLYRAIVLILLRKIDIARTLKIFSVTI